ncbi:MAG TPA: HAMP domain-containing sensor histidine kinase [Flexivirga sp.]|uniref:HAMP domain-containing sensor histidine kinase n=1 Tax=Flexivirga sp. TaxID=1962927 RepID=UPI002CA8F89C|nr:HAMP domain-containing sensor histidine kinase [Flexivirga sp.]HWC22470.1 HAMP domain-containing sensor histidine kinase [Flexivirga sp.]
MGIRGRAVFASILIVLLVAGGTAVAVVTTVGTWVYSVARSQAQDQFTQEARRIQDAHFFSPRQIDASPDMTIVVDGRIVRLGTAKSSDLTADLTSTNHTDLQVQRRTKGPYRVLFGTQVTVQGPPGSGGLQVQLYSVRPLLGVHDKIVSIIKVVGICLGVGVLLGALVALWLSRYIVRPLRRIDRAAARASDGDITVRLGPQGAPELEQLVHSFNGLMDTHEHSLQQSRRFAADVSHELRTPLAALLPAGEVLQEESASMSPDAREAAGLLHAEIHNLARLVEDLIEISRHDSRQTSLSLDEVDLVGLTRQVLRHRGWSEVVSVRTAQPHVPVVVDRRRIELVLANLVSNAVQHGRPPVTVALGTEPGRTVLEVTNAGEPIPQQVQDRLFDRFYKGETARTRTQGSGLGLALTLENVRLHHGTISVHSDESATTFRVTLPNSAERQDN